MQLAEMQKTEMFKYVSGFCLNCFDCCMENICFWNIWKLHVMLTTRKIEARSSNRQERLKAVNLLNYPRPSRPLPQCLWPQNFSVCAWCRFFSFFFRQGERVNVASLRWAALSAQQQSGDWCSSQWQSWALHRAGKLKGKRLPASISCRE